MSVGINSIAVANNVHRGSHADYLVLRHIPEPSEILWVHSKLWLG